MSMLAFVFMPGIIELVIMLMCLVVFIGIVLLVVVLTTQKANRNPDLYPCPDCGRPVSVNAESCPQCGYPLKTESHDDDTKSEGKNGDGDEMP